MLALRVIHTDGRSLLYAIMSDRPTPSDVQRADAYDHPDDVYEVVFAVEDGRVLSVREYPSRETFSRAVAGATYRGTDCDVADLPDVSAFESTSRE